MTADRRVLLALMATTMLSACGAGSEEAQPAEEKTPAVEDTAFGDMVGTMDKAKGVQDTVDAHKQDMDQRVNEEAR